MRMRVPKKFFIFYLTTFKKSRYKKCDFCRGLVEKDDNYCKWCRFKLIK